MISEKFVVFLSVALCGAFAVLIIVSSTAGVKSQPSSQRAFLYVLYLGEQAKPFPFLVLTSTECLAIAELQQMLDHHSATARCYTVPMRQFYEIWQFLNTEYTWQKPPISPPFGEDLFEIVLWDESYRHTLMDRREMRRLLQHILVLTNSTVPNLSDEIAVLIRRLSN